MRWFLPPRAFLLIAGLMILAHWLVPSAQLLSGPSRSIGVVLIALGIGLSAFAKAQFQRARTNILTFNEPTLMVTHGVFGISRNPMYVGLMVALLGHAWLLGSAVPATGVVAFGMLLRLWFVPFEETAMEAKFGERYRAYTAATRRWI